MIVLILGLVLFFAVHSIRIVAPDWRENRIAAKGEGKWKGVYSIISLLSFALIVYGYSIARPVADIVYQPLEGMYHPVLLLMALSMILMMAFELGQGYIKKILRHPFLLAIILWSIAHLLMNGDMASILLFGSFLLWAVVDLKSALLRSKVDQPAPHWRSDALAVVAGLVIYGLIIWKLHAWVIGVVPSI